ncbi:hypothetical protein IC213_18385 [Clostridioides sp. ES-S-0049-02]|uniref:RCC1-like domain-containing protein n=1 Tax=Clostridioides sp. ES-S-0049-02 TaxID=2770778 RepID=UPI001D11351D|nr:hypothetical protein [Clostridioides sp. ES-S-0049-02]
MDRFEILKYLEFDIWHSEWPLELLKGAITKDNATNNLLLQLKLCNISDKEIKSAYFKIECFNDAGDLIDGNLKHVYQDINIKPHECLGDDIAIRINDNKTRTINVILEQVVFSNNEVYKYEREEGLVIPELDKIGLLKTELLEELKKDYEEYDFEYEIKYMPNIIEKKAWNCCCGKINKLEKDRCNNCKRSKTLQIKKINKNYLESLHKKSLKNKKEIEIKLEKDNKCKKHKLKNINKNNKKKSMLLISILLIFIIFIGKNIINKHVFLDEIKYKNEYNKKISVEKDNVYMLKDNGKVTHRKVNGESSSISGWEDIISIVSYEDSIIGLKKDGTVVSKGLEDSDSDNISKWIDIIDIECDSGTFVGLKKDGTVVATGNNDYGQCNVKNWSDIVSIEITKSTIEYMKNTTVIGIKKDGTVLLTGYDSSTHRKETDKWKGISKIKCGSYSIFGIKNDGTVVVSGGAYDIKSWKDIKDIHIGLCGIVGIKEDGTIISTDEKFNEIIKDWKNIISAEIIDNHEGVSIIGINSNGDILTSSRGQNLDNIKRLEDVEYINFDDPIDNFLVGIRKDNVIFIRGINNTIAEEYNEEI